MPHPSLDETYLPRTWACQECTHILGVVMRDSNRIRRLWVFSHARHCEDIPPVPTLQSAPTGMYLVHGLNSGKVQCTHCGALNEWTPSDEAFQRLMEHYPKKTV